MVVCPYPFFVKERAILLGRRQNTVYMPGYYSVPAGHGEENERLLDCLARETREEIGITFNPGDARLVHVMQRSEEDVRMDLFFLIERWQGTPAILETDKCDDLQFFLLNALPKNTVPYIQSAIVSWQNGVFYDEWGWKK